MVVKVVYNNLISGRKWTQEEKDIICQEYKGTYLSISILARRLNRTMDSVQAEIYRLNLGGYHKKFWTEKETEYLTELVGKYSVMDIKKKFAERGFIRSRVAILCKMDKLKLVNSYRDGWYTKTDVSDILGITSNKIQYYIDNKMLKASYHNGQKPTGFTGSKVWHIAEDDLREFIEKYSRELTGRNVDLWQIVEIFKAALREKK